MKECWDGEPTKIVYHGPLWSFEAMLYCLWLLFYRRNKVKPISKIGMEVERNKIFRHYIDIFQINCAFLLFTFIHILKNLYLRLQTFLGTEISFWKYKLFIKTDFISEWKKVFLLEKHEVKSLKCFFIK